MEAWLHRLWPVSRKKPHSIPLPTPVTVRRVDIPSLQRPDVVVGWKQNGVRVVLLFGWENDDVFVCKMNRKKVVLKTQYIAPTDVPENVSTDLFEGTLLDCEEMPDGTYVILDVVTCAGEGVHVLPFEERRQSFEAARGPYKAMMDKYNFFLRQKRWFPSVKRCVAYREACEDGLIFLDTALPYGYGADKNLKKWKTQHTVDLEKRGEAWGYTDRDGWRDAKELGIVVVEGSRRLDGIYEVERKEGGGWAVKMPRPDKRYPNFRTTVLDALTSIEENIELDEFCVSIK